MHARMTRETWMPNLAELFQELGVVVRDGQVTLVDDAPLAAVRRAITEQLPATSPEPSACHGSLHPWVAQR